MLRKKKKNRRPSQRRIICCFSPKFVRRSARRLSRFVRLVLRQSKLALMQTWLRIRERFQPVLFRASVRIRVLRARGEARVRNAAVCAARACREGGGRLCAWGKRTVLPLLGGLGRGLRGLLEALGREAHKRAAVVRRAWAGRAEIRNRARSSHITVLSRTGEQGKSAFHRRLSRRLDILKQAFGLLIEAGARRIRALRRRSAEYGRRMAAWTARRTPAQRRWGAALLAVLVVALAWPARLWIVQQDYRPVAPVRPQGIPRMLPAPRALAMAYPEAISEARLTPCGWIVRFSDGREESYADGRQLPFGQRLDQADLASVLSQPYCFGKVDLPVPSGQEAGRLRNYDLLLRAYGSTPDEVRANLEVVDFLGTAVWMNRRNGAAAALRAVSREILADREARAYVARIARMRVGRIRKGPGAGLYLGRCISGWNWRFVNGTRRLSAHSFGIAVDINNPYTTRPKYWLKRERRRGAWRRTAIEKVPWALVGIFERHGFIWGGKWHHFDTMHFEYRPEFLLAATGVGVKTETDGGADAAENLTCTSHVKGRQ